MKFREKLIQWIFLFILLEILQIKGNLVKTEINSSWKQTSIIAEMSEYLSQTSNENFWKFFDLINNEDLNKLTDEKIYQIGLFHVKNLIDKSEWKLFEASLSIRKFSPLIQTHYQLGQKYEINCKAFFVQHGKAKCLTKNIKFNYENSDFEEKLYPFDHQFPYEVSKNASTVIIYGQLGTEILKNAFSEIQSLLNSNKKKQIRLVFRHFNNNRNLSPISISGYGVELAIKNTEYKAYETSNTERNEMLKPVDKNPKEYFLNSSEIEFLSLQTSQKIIQFHKTNGSETLNYIKSLSQHFPNVARKLSQVKIEKQYRFASVLKNIQAVLGTLDIDSGNNFLSINGRIISSSNEEDHIDVFNLLEILKHEKYLAENIRSLGFKSNIVKLLSTIDFSPDLNIVFDYRKANPMYLNDLESKFGIKELKLILHGYPTAIMARNIFTVIIFVNPFESNSYLNELIEYQKKGNNIRIGIVYVCSDISKLNENDIQLKIFSKTRNFSKKNLIEMIKNGNNFLESTGLSNSSILLNGYPIHHTTSKIITELEIQIQKQTTILKKALFYDFIDSDVNIADFWISRKTNAKVVKRANKCIIDGFDENKFIDPDVYNEKEFKNFIKYRGNSEINEKNLAVNTWIIGDFDTEKGKQLALEGIKAVEKKRNESVVLISSSKNQEVFCRWIKIQKSYEIIKILKNTKFETNLTTIDNCDLMFSTVNKLLKPLQLSKSEMVVVSNGLFIRSIENCNFKQDDFNFLNKLWAERGVDKLLAEIKENKIETEVALNFILYAANAKKQFRHSDISKKLLSNFIKIEKKQIDKPAVYLTWILNPTTRNAQLLSSIVKIISDLINSEILIIFNPTEKLEKMPINRFYQFLMKSQLEFNKNGKLKKNAAIFNELPKNQLMTMSIHTNEAWMVEIKETKYDLDNILIGSINEEEINAVYSLEHILLEGSCKYTNNQPASGIELQIEPIYTNKNEIQIIDTIVMHNLGYFQLKAKPGIWTLEIRNNEKQNEFITFYDSNENKIQQNIQIIIDSFSGKWTDIVVEKKLKEPETNLLKSMKNVVSKVQNYFNSSDEDKVINIFSLASGHLYERFLRIMMVSVMKKTEKSKVKFWLLKNYLSPDFKNKIVKLSEKYGFEYELVEYEWPKWLNQEQEKQRIMWGYKILFLDVIFPLKLNKIIFVDADQVVRVDMQQLMDFPLDHAVYGYVPFCDNRKEMEGFRFWKRGYWKKVLGTRKYHISALYVIDLKKFREISAGDILRGQYYMLSKDPNSLSNLDQDLPNSMIDQVPIKSLPQDWLWCETWCSDESKKNAKTIDLCNNPLTKEPKLDSAKRIIPEWKEYDEEIQLLWKNKKDLEKILKSSSEEL